MPIQPIYMPPQPGGTMGEAAGKALGAALTAYIQRSQAKRQVEQMQQFQQAIESAPDRSSAMEVFNKIPFQNIDQMNQAKAWFNTVHPPKETTMKEVSTFDPQTGAETKQFVAAGDLPEFSSEAQKAGQTLSKPDMQEFYQLNPDGSYKNIGRFPISNRPAGAATMDELKLLEQQKTDKLKIEAADRADKRFQASMEKLAEAGSTQAASKEITQMKAYNGVVSSMLNVKKSIGQNGEIILDFGGDSKIADAYRSALESGSDYIKKYKGDINKAAAAALKDAGAFDKPMPEAPAAPAAPQPGFLSSLLQSIRGQSTPAAPKAPATPTKDTFELGKIYKDAKGNRAKYLGDGKWEPVK